MYQFIYHQQLVCSNTCKHAPSKAPRCVSCYLFAPRASALLPFKHFYHLYVTSALTAPPAAIHLSAEDGGGGGGDSDGVRKLQRTNQKRGSHETQTNEKEKD